MAQVNESNFPNSRITAKLQAINYDNQLQILGIHGQAVGGKNCLMVQIAQASNNPLVTNTNLTSYQGMTAFNISNPFIPESYNDVQLVQATLTDSYRHYKDATYIASILVTYSDSTKKTMVRTQRVIESGL